MKKLIIFVLFLELNFGIGSRIHWKGKLGGTESDSSREETTKIESPDKYGFWFGQRFSTTIDYEDITTQTEQPTINSLNNEIFSDEFLQTHKIDLPDNQKYLALGLVVDKLHSNYTANELAKILSKQFSEIEREKWISIVIHKDSSFDETDSIITQLEDNIVGNFWFTYGNFKVILLKTTLKQYCSDDILVGH